MQRMTAGCNADDGKQSITVINLTLESYNIAHFTYKLLLY